MKTFLIAAITADGFIAEQTDQVSTAWTSKADKQFFSERTKQAGVMVMGRRTYDTIGRGLPGRLTIVLSRTASDTQMAGKAWSDLSSREQTAGQVIFTDVSPEQILSKLTQAGFEEVAICGGSSVYSLFMKSKLINTLYLTIEPVVFGEGVKLFNQPIDQELELVQVTDLSDQTKLLEYKVK